MGWITLLLMGVILRTGYKNKRDWYLLPIREMLDNDVDFLWNHYKGSDKESIKVNIEMDDEFFHLKIANTNGKNIPVFRNLEAIFDYEMRYGSKQDLHIISRGMLGDAMKQILSLGDVLIHMNDDGTAWGNKQWEHPLIIRHNKREYSIYLDVDRATQEIKVNPISGKEINTTDTEIELWLPVIDEVRNGLTRDYVEKFCRESTLFTTDISFNFTIVDDINHSSNNDNATQLQQDEIGEELVAALSKTPEKGILHIDMPALHAISTDKDWSNANSIHSYKPDEFMRRLTNVYDKSISVYSVLLTFREGSQIKKTPENQISVSELLASKRRENILKTLYKQLRNALPVQEELSLPYTTKTKKRKEILYSRIAQSKFYDIDPEKEASYRLVRGMYDDTQLKKVWSVDENYGRSYTYERGQGIVKYPFAFEILAIPRKDPLTSDAFEVSYGKDCIIIGAVNYSVSPKSNIFQGEYTIPDSYSSTANDIHQVLYAYKFSKNPDNNVKLPCIVIANLVTPRRDPVGYDKSIIDTQPFTNIIVNAVRKMASNIQTYRAAGHEFERWHGSTTGRYTGERNKESGKDIVRQFLIDQRGLPS